MKKIFTAIAVFAFAGGIVAQPTITSAWIPATGTNISTQSADTTGITEGSAGANQTWDYTNLQNMGSAAGYAYVAPSTTPYASSFTTSNLAFYGLSSGGNTSYAYFNSTANDFSLMGVGTTQYVINYSNPMVQMQFPSTFNTNFTDAFTATGTYTVGYTLKRSGTHTLTADGYGTLKLPGGKTHNNVLRVKSVQMSFDTLISGGIPLVTIVSTTTTYNWISPASNGLNLLSIFTIVQTTSGSGTVLSKSVSYSPIAPNSLNEANSHTGLHVYPNPAKDKFAISFDKPVSENSTLALYDLNGRLAKVQQITTGSNLVEVATTDIRAGIYMAAITDANGITKRAKVVVE